MSGSNMNIQQIPFTEEVSKEKSSAYLGMNSVFSHTQTIINGMQVGEKITVKDLNDKVAAINPKLTLANVTNLVQMFLKDSNDVTVEIGRNGGVYKGGKQKRVDHRPRCGFCNQVVRSKKHETIEHA